MRRKLWSIALTLVLVFSMVLPATARSNVITDVDPFLYFEGDIAYCTLMVGTVADDVEITAHVTLSIKNGNDYQPVAMWRNRAGVGELNFHEEVTNRPAGEYQLKVDVSASGYLGSDHVVGYSYATCRGN